MATHKATMVANTSQAETRAAVTHSRAPPASPG
jgi:hypothetical protein